MNIEKYKAMVSEDTKTMKSIDLHKFVYEATGKFKELSGFHKKIVSVLQSHIDDSKMESSTDARGYVNFYTMNEVQCNMVLGSIDISHLEKMSEIFVAVKNNHKPKSQMLMIAEMAMQMHNQNVAVEEAKLEADRANERLDDVDNLIENNKSKEVRPHQGYYSLKSLQNKLASKFQKAHIRGVLFDEKTMPKIRSHNCRKYVEETLSYEEYMAHSIADVESVIDDLIKTGVRVINANGKPSQKVKSPLYGQAFKYPL